MDITDDTIYGYVNAYFEEREMSVSLHEGEHLSSLSLIGSWDVSNVTNMTGLFRHRKDFDVQLNWDVSNVTDMSYMFEGCQNFNRALTYKGTPWNVSKVITMRDMFHDCRKFNKPLDWETDNVIDMMGMFRGCHMFNSDLNFNTSNVKNMDHMFAFCPNFNKDLYWNVSNVEDMDNMFKNCRKFNRDLSRWNPIKLITNDDMFKNCPLNSRFMPTFNLVPTQAQDATTYTEWSSDADIMFNTDIIEEYTHRISSKVKLLCNAEIMTYFNPTGTKPKIVRKIRDKLSFCCRNEINGFYIDNAIENVLFGKNNHYHLLTAVFNTDVLGFIIAEYGECKFIPNVWSVKLICTSPEYPTVSGSVILGAMLYLLKKINARFVILELAGGYTNFGFITYSKLGFIKNLSLLNENCFNNSGNLPMYVSLEHLTTDIIVELVNGTKKIKLTPEQDDTGFFEKYLNKDKYTDEEAEDANNKYLGLLYACDAHKDMIIIESDDEVKDIADSFIDQGLANSIPATPTLLPQTYAIITMGGKRTRHKHKSRKRKTRNHTK
jgi:surface protein